MIDHPLHISEKVSCFHCGSHCDDSGLIKDEKHFCCSGCVAVYEILQENELCGYYDLNANAGVSLKAKNFNGKFDFLNEEAIVNEIIDFKNEEIAKVTLKIPSIHCSSCVWLLENLHKVKNGVAVARLNFVKKELSISYIPKQTSLKEIVELLATLGYEPEINLGNKDKNPSNFSESKKLILKIGLVGFCAGNIMMMSFPEYFNLDLSNKIDASYQKFFLYFNFLLSLPVFFYGASDYLKGAFLSLKEYFNSNTNILSVDIPIAMGISALFFRSTFETLVNHSAGYWDSLAGLVLFLLVGKWVQQVTFGYLSFDRNYKSYFPLAVKMIDDSYKNVKLLLKKDRYYVHHQELIPADSILMAGNAWIDYSFVTGESQPQHTKSGQVIFAGGRQMADAIELEVLKPVSTSYLTQLWNNESFSKEKKIPTTELANLFSKYFTVLTLFIAIVTGIYWQINDPSLVWPSLTAVLMVACPCALTLSMPFTMNAAMSIFGKNKFFVKNQGVIQLLNETDTIVFDKTGTLTHNRQGEVKYHGIPLSNENLQAISSICSQSLHPLSKLLVGHLQNLNHFIVNDFIEVSGAGLRAKVGKNDYKIGSAIFCGQANESEKGSVFIEINGECYGYFSIDQVFRNKWEQVLLNLKKRFKILLVSGDSEKYKRKLEPFFNENIYFNQKPQDKLEIIKELQKNGKNVIMVGDGLNDAGALREAKIGIALSEDVQAFSPSCDAILDANNFEKLPVYVNFSKTVLNIVKLSFLLSVVYNIFGVGWAVSGQLSPVLAAIFMPLSSLSVVLFAVGVTYLTAKVKNL